MQGFLAASVRSVAGRVMGAMGALLSSYAVAQTLPIQESGLFFLSLGFAIFFSHALRFGLDSFALKKCAIFLTDARQHDFLSLVIACVLVSFCGGLLLFGLAQVFALLPLYEHATYLARALPAAMALAVVGVVANSLHAMGFVFTATVTDVALHYLLFSACLWWFPPTNATEALLYFAVCCVLVLCLQAFIAMGLYIRRGIALSGNLSKRLSAVDYREMYLTALPIWVIVIAQQFNMWGSQFISSAHVPEEDLAVLAVANRIAMVVPMMLIAINMVVSSGFASHYHKGELDKVEEILKSSLKLLSVASLAVFAVILLFGTDLLRVFGEEYTEARLILSILVCGQLVNAMTGPSGRLLLMSGFEKDFRNSTLLVTAAGLVLAVILVTHYGIYGAAVATAITVATQNLALAHLVHKRVQINVLGLYTSMFKRG